MGPGGYERQRLLHLCTTNVSACWPQEFKKQLMTLHLKFDQCLIQDYVYGSFTLLTWNIILKHT